jgi:hypothetical protein
LVVVVHFVPQALEFSTHPTPHFITRHARLHTQMIFFLLSNIVDFICKNTFQKVLIFFDKPYLWPNKMGVNAQQSIFLIVRNDLPITKT